MGFLPERYDGRQRDRAIGSALSTIQGDGFLQRATHEAQRELALARMTDIGIATRHGLSEGDEIVRDLARRLEHNPLGIHALGGIAEVGIRGVERVLRDLSEGR